MKKLNSLCTTYSFFYSRIKASQVSLQGMELVIRLLLQSTTEPTTEPTLKRKVKNSDMFSG